MGYHCGVLGELGDIEEGEWSGLMGGVGVGPVHWQHGGNGYVNLIQPRTEDVALHCCPKFQETCGRCSRLCLCD